MKENSELSNRRKNILGAGWLWLGVLVFALALPLASPAQDTGYISGTVTDDPGGRLQQKKEQVARCTLPASRMAVVVAFTQPMILAASIWRRFRSSA